MPQLGPAQGCCPWPSLPVTWLPPPLTVQIPPQSASGPSTASSALVEQGPAAEGEDAVLPPGGSCPPQDKPLWVLSPQQPCAQPRNTASRGPLPGRLSRSVASSGATDEPASGLASRGLASLGLTCDTFNEGPISLTQLPRLCNRPC